MLHKSVGIFAHFKEIRLLARLLYGASAVGTLTLGCLRFGKEGLAGSTVPALVLTLVYIALIVEFLKYLLYGCLVALVGGADKIIVARIHSVPDTAYFARNSVNVLLWSNSRSVCKVLYFLTVLVGTRTKINVVSARSLVTRDRIGHYYLISISEVRLS